MENGEIINEEEGRKRHRERNREHMQRKRLALKLGIPFERKRAQSPFPRKKSTKHSDPVLPGHCHRCGISFEFLKEYGAVLTEYGGEIGNDTHCRDCLNEMGMI